MSVITSGKTFANGEQLTADKLNEVITGATFSATEAVDNSTTGIDGSGAIIVRDGGITPAKLSAGGPSWDTNSNLLISGSVTGDVDDGALVIYGGTNTNGANIELYGGSHASDANKIYHDADAHVFRDTSLTERMRITSDGYVVFDGSQTNPSSSYDPNQPEGVSIWPNKIEVSRDGGIGLEVNRVQDGAVCFWRRAGNPVGNISVSSSATSYNTSSDYRLKEDIIDISDSLERLKALKPCNFAWKVDGSRVDGFIAHEAQEVVPEAVTGTKDAVDSEGNPEYQGIDQAKLVPLLTKALQEAVTKIEALEARVTELES